jgi:prepilin-type N-terminal cleavage/methylation domain-containing protein
MLQVMRKKAAFTLIELLVVVIIVAVLAAVGIPLMAGQIARARASEAEAGLGTVRTAMRSYFAENQDYTGANFTNIGINYDATGITSLDDDLDGRWFSDDGYSIGALSPTGYCVSVTGAASQAPKKDQVNGLSGPVLARSMDQDGFLWDQTGCATGGGTLLN